nr:MAG: ORF1 [TTV-like mini virus]
MPWYYPRRRRYRRRWTRFWRRPRKTFRSRYRRRRYPVRNYKKKLKRLILTEWQPACIRKCKIQGKLPLFETDYSRVNNNFEMYELSLVPEHLSGGGGWSIKMISLRALFSEHEYCRNYWTYTNKNLPLCRYTGCSIKLYQSKHADYIFSYSTQMPMQSTIEMYQSMQPSIHAMLPHHIVVPSRHTYPKKKPYYKLHIKPPKPFVNKWYFQSDMTNTPLVLFKTSATSLQDYYINPEAQSTNLTIPILNTGLFKNRNWKTPQNPGYSPYGDGTNKVYLYSTSQIPHNQNLENPSAWLKWVDVIPLYDTQNHTEGSSYTEAKNSDASITGPEAYKTKWLPYRGNPFHERYLGTESPVYQSKIDYSSILNKANFTTGMVENFTLVSLTYKLRYNPYNDHGRNNMCYFLSIAKEEQGWEPPEKPELVSVGLPLWLLLFGFADWQKKLKKLLHLSTDYVCVVKSTMTYPVKQPLVMLNQSFIDGNSPQEQGVNIEDAHIWHPQFQFQELTHNDIVSSGPGIIRLTQGQTVEASLDYKFYFKWGGNPPPMDTIKDPGEQPTYPIPRNELLTNSLQNPATDPSTFLWQFDERRGQITEKAAKRLQTDYSTETTSFTDGAHHFSPPIQTTKETSPETSSEEEEEETPLLLKLQQQYLQQQQLRHRILKTMKKLQKLE